MNDIIWYSESGVKPNTLVRFDPKDQKFQTWVIPSGGGVVRNMMHTADGKLVLTESGENKVALVTVTDGKKMAMTSVSKTQPLRYYKRPILETRGWAVCF